MFSGAAFACNGPERGFRVILFALERDHGFLDTCPPDSSGFWLILLVSGPKQVAGPVLGRALQFGRLWYGISSLPFSCNM